MTRRAMVRRGASLLFAPPPLVHLLRRHLPWFGSYRVVTFVSFVKPVTFVVGKTFRRLKESEAEIMKTAKNKNRRLLDHEFTFYADIIEGVPDDIRHVQFAVIGKKFHPGKYTSYYPYKFFLESEQRYVYRFSTPSYILSPVPLHCDVKLIGRGGTKKQIRIPANQENFRGVASGDEYRVEEFSELRRMMRIEPVTLPFSIKYGVEMEVGLVARVNENNVYDIKTPKQIATSLGLDESEYFKHHFELVQRPRDDNKIGGWVMDMADMNKDVSLSEVAKILKNINRRNALAMIRKHMRFHVSCKVDRKNLDGLIKICQNFVQFEPAIDAILQAVQTTTNETGNTDKFYGILEDENNEEDETALKYLSNREMMQGQTNQERHDILARCKSIQELCDIMNPGGVSDNKEHYYGFKLNVQNILVNDNEIQKKDEDDEYAKVLKVEREKLHRVLGDNLHKLIGEDISKSEEIARTLRKIEFRYHFGSHHSEEVMNWIRFCVHFVNNSLQQSSTSSLLQHTVLDDDLAMSDQIDRLFNDVIQCRYIELFYKERIKGSKLATSEYVESDDDDENPAYAYLDDPNNFLGDSEEWMRYARKMKRDDKKKRKEERKKILRALDAATSAVGTGHENWAETENSTSSKLGTVKSSAEDVEWWK